MPFHISMPVAAAMLVFMVVSIVIGSALAGAGGWRTLEARYPAIRASSLDEERYRFSSIRTAGGPIGTATYNSCVTIGVGAGGISLALWAPFGLFHPPVFLPWDAVARCRVVEFPVGTFTELTVTGGVSIVVGGRAGQAIRRRAILRGLLEEHL